MNHSDHSLKRKEIEPWLANFHEFRKKHCALGIQAFQREFQRLTAELQPLRASAAERIAEEAPNFNVFRILRLERKELITHSPFLANLLNPAGTHSQGDLFLRLLIECLTKKRVPVPASVAGGRWFVRQEQVTDSGTLDIHVWSHRLRCQIVIENKIGAADQEDQLSRYWDHMQRDRKQFDFQTIIYLTPQSRSPKVTGRPLPPFINLTYRDDICALLRAAHALVPSPRLRYSLEQYLEIAATC